MLESLLSEVLERVLGRYVRGIDRKQLSVGVLKGDFTLRNLQLNVDALRELDLPIRVTQGFVGALTIRVKWNKLKSEGCSVSVDNVILLLHPSFVEHVNADDAFKQKMRRLEVSEKDFKREIESQAKKKSDTASKLAEKLLAHLRVTVNNVHLCYEDNLTDPSRCMVGGITLRRFEMCSADSYWVRKRTRTCTYACMLAYTLARSIACTRARSLPRTRACAGSGEDGERQRHQCRPPEDRTAQRPAHVHPTLIRAPQ